MMATQELVTMIEQYEKLMATQEMATMIDDSKISNSTEVTEDDDASLTDDDASLTDDDKVDIPHEFLCPLTLEIMTDPLMNRYGHTYERSAILEWLNRGNMICPMTKQPLTPSGLIPNTRLRDEIVAWQMDNGYTISNPEKYDLPFFKAILILPPADAKAVAAPTPSSQQRPRRNRPMRRLVHPFRSSAR